MIGPARRRRLLKNLLLAMVSVGFAVSVCEGLILLALSHPSVVRRLPARLRGTLRRVYMTFDQDIIQFEPAYARYDERVFYTLRPGRFTFANREFSTEYRVNSLGVRDEESALDEPEVVVTGDSYAMGWGVEQEETLARRLERMTGMKVLNAAVSSYGATRELTLLDRVSFARVKYLVIQHCGNDFDEDEAFALRQNRLIVGTRERFEQVQRRFAQSRRYWFGSYLYKLLFRRNSEDAAEERAPDWPRRAEQFLNVLAHASSHDLDGVQVIVFDLGSDREFLRALERLHSRATYPRYIQRMKILDVAALLDESHFLILDEHLNAAGHERIASEVADAIEDSE